MIYLASKQLCFVCPPKNGTHTLYRNLSVIGGQRIGEFHEYRRECVPAGAQVVMVWRDPVERAVSLYKDIVGRELEDKRKVTHPDSIALHEKIIELAPDFGRFVDLLVDDGRHPSPYLLKPQSWWIERFGPGRLYPLGQLGDLLFELVKMRPEVVHTGEDLETVVKVSELQEKRLRTEWDDSHFV